MSFSGNAIGLTAFLFVCAPCCLLRCPAQEQAESPASSVSEGADRSLDDARGSIAASDYESARTKLEAYLRGNSTSAEAHYLLGYSLLHLNDAKASLAEYTRAAQLRIPSAEELRYVAEDYALLDDYADAERWMQRSLQMDGRDPDTWYGLGRIQYTLQKYPLAVESFQKALTLAPNSVKVEDNLALSYEGLNREEDAVAAYQRALDWQKDSDHPSEQPMLNLAIILIRKGSLEEAERLLKQAVAIAPKDPRIRDQLGHLYMQQEQFAKAQIEFEQAVALAPENASFHFLLGRVYRHEGIRDKADVEFARAAKLKGGRSTAAAP